MTRRRKASEPALPAENAAAAEATAAARASIGVVLAEARQLVRVGLAALIESQPGMKVLLESGDADEVIRGLARIRSRMKVRAIVGLGLSGEHDAFWLIRTIREKAPTWPVIACGRHAPATEISRALLVGADGYVDEECPPGEFIEAVRGATIGQLVLAGVPDDALGGIANDLDRPPPGPPLLTERELEVLAVATKGLTARQIGRQLGVHERTVTTHLGRIYKKLGATSRTGAIAAAASAGLLSVGERT